MNTSGSRLDREKGDDMKCRWLYLCVACLGFLLSATSVQADKPFGEGSLLGTFAFTEIHVRVGDIAEVPIAHCSGYGTITFYGDGDAFMEGVERCSDDPDDFEEYGGYVEYVIGDTGTFFEIVVPNDPDTGPTQCQLVQKDTMILCDGTKREAEMLSFHAVGVKQ